MDDALKGHWYGPMPIDEFFEDFLPLDEEQPASRPPFPPNDYFDTIPPAIPGDKDSETELSKAFVALVEKYLSLPATDIEFGIVHDKESGRRGYVELHDTLMVVDEDSDQQIPNEDAQEDITTLFRYGLYTPCDPFEFHPLTVDIDEESAQDDPNIFRNTGTGPHKFVRFDCQCLEFCRGIVAERLENWLATRYRTHAFMIFIGDPWVRFIRADRCGAVYSQKFDFRQDSRQLLDFYWRYTQLSVEDVGLDPTVRPATKQEARLARSLLPQLKNLKPEDIVEPIMVITIQDEKTRTYREVISCRPPGVETPLVGKGTRAWPVFDMELRRIVFFKETWRSSETGMVKEASTLRVLNDASVRNVPKLVAGGDIDGDSYITRSHRYFRSKWNFTGYVYCRARALHRLAVDFVGIPLEGFSSTKQLLAAVYDAFVAHYDAYEKCRIIHCDISAGNILMDANGHGYLNDWDMAKSVNALRGLHCHLGTWRFMSANLLRDPKKTNDMNDDIESFIYVVVYTVLRYTRHNKVDVLPKILHTIFEEKEKVDGDICGGSGKAIIGEILRDWEILGNEPLQAWLEQATSAVTEWILHDPVALDDISNHRRRASSRIKDKAKPKPRLEDHAYLLTLFEEALADPNWPTHDFSRDYFSENKDERQEQEQQRRQQQSVNGTEPENGAHNALDIHTNHQN